MIISHNVSAMNINRITNENINLHGKSTRKVSSGYRINCAADDAAGLAISEVMRRQIRGLVQATNNTKDGVGFVQSADGAMEEIHSMLQRMNELTVKALQGTYSDSDRMAMNAEFDQLRTEIDRINQTTEFGTDFPVFEEHEPSYYQISGNRKWDDNQLHTISPMANALKIHLPDGYEPKDYTISVPAGTYTTQELVDEIDDALSNMVPPNPGFVFELTGDGYCNLRFEKADGTPTKIDFVDGTLSYLLYDFQGGTGSSDILGTTIFEVDQKIVIVKGKNDELGFYLEGAAGSQDITITIREGAYTREKMIEAINASGKLPSGVTAAIYGDYCIQIMGGSDVAITGLHGNMFRYEESSPIYNSVFYDNVKYGICSYWSARIIGQPNELPIHISESNCTLKFKLNGDDVTLNIPPSPEEGYTVSQLAGILDTLFKNNNLNATANVYYSSYPSSSPSLSISSTIKGESSSLVFDTSEACYKTLFLGTSMYPDNVVGNVAYIVGAPDLSKGIILDKKGCFGVLINEKPYTFFLNEGEYTLENLIEALRPQVKEKGLEGTIEFKSNGTNLAIEACNSDVKSLNIMGMPGDDTDEKLFTTKILEPQGSFANQSARKETEQGIVTGKEPPSAMATSAECKSLISINKNSNTITFNIAGPNSNRLYTIDNIKSGDYTVTELAEEIEKQIKELAEKNNDPYLQNVEVENYGGCLRFKFTPRDIAMHDGSWTIDIPFDSEEDALNNSIWKEVFETEERFKINSQPAKSAALTMKLPLDTNINIDDTNCALKLKLQIDAETSYEADLNILQDPPKTYNNIYDLRDDLWNAIKGTALDGMVNVDVVGGRLQFTADIGTFEANGTFYDEVMSRGMRSNCYSYTEKGGCNYDPAFVIGRQDLTTGPIEITGSNNEFIFDITHNGVKKEIKVTIEEGIYNGNKLAGRLEELIQDELNKEGLDYFEVDVRIGGHEEINLPNTDNSTVLQITLNRAPGKEPDEGQYIIDGIRGSAATSIFYKSTDTPTMTYIVGTKNIWEGISFEPGKNVLTLSANSVPYQYTFDKPYYTAREFIDVLNNMFEKGDDNGNPAPLRASIDDSGALKISYTVAGANTITDIGGSGRSAIFFEEEGRDSRDPLSIHVGSEAYQSTEIPRISVSSVALGINSITISRQKYAEKANIRIKDAIKTLSSKRSTYGAIQNRLEHTINNNDIIIDRMQESESHIRDTDLSSEMTHYTNLSILLRTGSAMIAESNKRIEKLMTILQ